MRINIQLIDQLLCILITKCNYKSVEQLNWCEEGHINYIVVNVNKQGYSYNYRVVTRWPGSQKVWGSIPSATKIVRCNNLPFNIGECVSRGSDTMSSCWFHVYRESHPRACKIPQGACQ